MTYEQNIKQVYDRASDTDIITGKNWYQSAYDSAVRIANGDASKGAGCNSCILSDDGVEA